VRLKSQNWRNHQGFQNIDRTIFKLSGDFAMFTTTRVRSLNVGVYMVLRGGASVAPSSIAPLNNGGSEGRFS
jgi:hypothetical protein